MPYSAVTHPLPVPRRNGGTRSSVEAVQITLVLPTSINTDPSACRRYPGVMRVGRIAPASRPSSRVMKQSLSFPNRSSRARKRPAKIEVAGKRINFFAADENLHRGHVGEIGRE